MREDLKVRRRGVSLLLDVPPVEFRERLGMRACVVSGLLNGTKHLRPEQWDRMEKLLTARLKELFVR